MQGKAIVLIALNLLLVGFFIFLFTRRRLLTYHHQRHLWLTWLAVGVITLMDECTSPFFGIAEAYRFIGIGAVVFLAITNLLMRFMSFRYAEIAEILEHHKLIGGGVYSFSYFVLGPTVSFIAAASILVGYMITACISSVSAIGNALPFTPYAHLQNLRLFLALGIIWFIAGLNIAGIKANARFTFGIFIIAALVMLNLVASGLVDFGRLGSWPRLQAAFAGAAADLQKGSWPAYYGNFVTSIAYCILAYSGIESVIQTAGLVRRWQDIYKAYWFLALTVGVVTPLIATLALTAPLDPGQHELDLLTHYATVVNGAPFGMLVAIMAAIALSMAVNTAFVASSELLERVAQRYRLKWLIASNRRHSLYRIHLLNAVSYTAIVLIAGGQQALLAEMFAVGLVASFCINMGCLLLYRYSAGTIEIEYHTSRLGTLILWIILVSCFGFLAVVKIHGTVLWAIVIIVVLSFGLLVSRRHDPEIKEIAKGDTAAEMFDYLDDSRTRTVHLFFHHRREPQHGRDEKAPGLERTEYGIHEKNSAYVTFYSPQAGAPPKAAANHFRFPLSRYRSMFQEMVEILRLAEAELPDRHVVAHIGWPVDSWLDRMAIGVMFFNLGRLPRMFPEFGFIMRYTTKVPLPLQEISPPHSGKKKHRKETGHKSPSSPENL
ncbi:MAG: APC family permease [Deltaproteobacteria bacterium]|nr:MAG: APC family permease [Deltaproteobacteria bacterium]